VRSVGARSVRDHFPCEKSQRTVFLTAQLPARYWRTIVLESRAFGARAWLIGRQSLRAASATNPGLMQRNSGRRENGARPGVLFGKWRKGLRRSASARLKSIL
jgi:hypothetical protein